MTCARELAQLLSTHGIEPESECGARFFSYLRLLEKWNRRVNLVSCTSWAILGPLFEEAILAGEIYPKRALWHLDIGSGAGFPALPMRLLNPSMQLRMVESRSKRGIFLETACAELGLLQTSVSNCTLEKYLRTEGKDGGWDCISWKAIILTQKDFDALAEKAKEGTLFWVFHGKELPVEGGEWNPALRLNRREAIPGKPAWFLSIFSKHS